MPISILLIHKLNALATCANIYITPDFHPITLQPSIFSRSNPAQKYLTCRLAAAGAVSTITGTVPIYIYNYQPVVVFLCWYNNRYTILIPIIQCSSATPEELNSTRPKKDQRSCVWYTLGFLTSDKGHSTCLLVGPSCNYIVQSPPDFEAILYTAQNDNKYRRLLEMPYRWVYT